MPPKQPQPPYAKDERVLCFHHEMLYEAKILDIQQGEGGEGWQFKIHYKGWKNTWDDWVPQDRVRKFSDENKELASQLQSQMKMLHQKNAKPFKKGPRANGSDFSSARGSEERNAGAAATSGRGPRRARDFDLEHVSISVPPFLIVCDLYAPSSCPIVHTLDPLLNNGAVLLSGALCPIVSGNLIVLDSTPRKGSSRTITTLEL
jgi:mortality factor 4-like protein 1